MLYSMLEDGGWVGVKAWLRRVSRVCCSGEGSGNGIVEFSCSFVDNLYSCMTELTIALKSTLLSSISPKNMILIASLSVSAL